MNDRPNFVEFCFNHPMYAEISFGDGEKEIEAIRKFLAYKGRSDGYCVGCSNDTVFILNESVSDGYKYEYTRRAHRLFSVTFHCARNEGHIAVFHFLQLGAEFQKIGQYPSLADTAIGELDRFRKVLNAENSREFHKALGLAAHDVGIGSFVYLRRVLERLVDGRMKDAIAAGTHKAEDFDGKRVSERIALMKGHLPDLLVENKKIYTVLSKGVHELTEEECLKYFPAIRELMFLILEEDLEKRRKAEHLKTAVATLEGI